MFDLGELTTTIGGMAIPASIRENEVERLAAVRRYDILDTPPDGAFDRVTALAARACGTPIAIVSVVDTDRIWFKSHHGLDVDQIDREPGLCASAILQDQPWIVEDARTDPRTLANSLVAGEFGLRFYVGIPLQTSDGYNLGTLCVIDREPRAVTDREIADLTDLAAIVVDELELRRASAQAIGLESEMRRQAEELARALQESLLPPELPELAGIELAARYVPAHRERVGGDFYDAFDAESTLGLVVGDVCGHGPAAAALTSMARHSVRVLTAGDWSPAKVLERTHEAIVAADTTGEGRFCTVALLRLDRADIGFKATVALGGHPRPLVVGLDGTVKALGQPGSLVGSAQDPHYSDAEIHLAAGDRLILYTDGLTDAGRGRQLFDEDALLATLAGMAALSADEIADGLLTAVAALDTRPRDDIALLVARICT